MRDLHVLEGLQAISFFGPPGSGKGTQAKILSSFSNVVHLSTGELFRSMPKDHPFFARARSFTQRGELVPDEDVLSLLCDYIEGLEKTFRLCRKRDLLLLDGMPRNAAQAKLILEAKIDLKAIVHLELKNEEELCKRLAKRAKLEGRVDDASIDAIKERLRLYRQESCKALEILGEQAPLHQINAARPCAEVSSDLCQALSMWLAS